MKKTFLVALTKNYQKVELSVELDDNELAELNIANVKSDLVGETRAFLTAALEAVESIKDQPKQELPQQANQFQAPQGERTLSQKQKDILIKNNLWKDGMSYDEGKEKLDTYFNNKSKYQNNNNFRGNNGNNNRNW